MKLAARNHLSLVGQVLAMVLLAGILVGEPLHSEPRFVDPVSGTDEPKPLSDKTLEAKSDRLPGTQPLTMTGDIASQ